MPTDSAAVITCLEYHLLNLARLNSRNNDHAIIFLGNPQLSICARTTVIWTNQLHMCKYCQLWMWLKLARDRCGQIDPANHLPSIFESACPFTNSMASFKDYFTVWLCVTNRLTFWLVLKKQIPVWKISPKAISEGQPAMFADRWPLSQRHPCATLGEPAHHIVPLLLFL